MTLGACGRGVCFIGSLNLGLEICRNGLSRMFSFPDYISWDNTRGPILHLAPEPIILSCSTCQTSLKLSPASWPIHLLCHPWPRHLENWDPAIKLKFSFSLSPSNTWPWLEGKEKNPQILATCSSNLWALNSQSLFIFCFKKWLYVLLGVTPVLRTELLDHAMWLNSLTPSLCSLWHQ